jgi:hypothetical protein
MVSMSHSPRSFLSPFSNTILHLVLHDDLQFMVDIALEMQADVAAVVLWEAMFRTEEPVTLAPTHDGIDRREAPATRFVLTTH